MPWDWCFHTLWLHDGTYFRYEGLHYTMDVITHMIDNIEVPRFRDQNNKDRKQNGDMVVTSLRWETHRSGELTDTLADNTDEATRSWSGDVSGNIRNTYMDTCAGGSHWRYKDRDDCLLNQSVTGTKLVMLQLTISNDICEYLCIQCFVL